MDSMKPKRSAPTTLIAVIAIAVGSIGSIISFISALMFVAGSYGTANANPLEAIAMIAGPPFCAVAGIGLLMRKRWAWACSVVLLSAVLAWQAWQIVSPPPAEDRTHISPSGVRVTVLGSGPTYSPPVIGVSLAALIILLSKRSRAEFPPPAGKVAVTSYPEGNERRGETRQPEGSTWRVGHVGRDRMYYEEKCGDTWRRITIDGEMLAGRAHHVIYFASPESWLGYPEWARHRRDEIMARIKSEFREPDYEYAAGGSASSPEPLPTAISPNRSRMKAPEMRALVIALIFLLGITAVMAWLVTSGLRNGETYWPAKRVSQQRLVIRAKEPAMFWTSIVVYSGIGAGTLVVALRVIRYTRS